MRAPGKSSIAFDNVSILLGSLIISILLYGYLYDGSVSVSGL